MHTRRSELCTQACSSSGHNCQVYLSGLTAQCGLLHLHNGHCIHLRLSKPHLTVCRLLALWHARALLLCAVVQPSLDVYAHAPTTYYVYVATKRGTPAASQAAQEAVSAGACSES